MDERLRVLGIHAERVLTELARVAFSDIRKLYREDGTLKSPKEWDEETSAAVMEVEGYEKFQGRGQARTLIGYTKRVTLFDKVKALVILAKHLKLLPTGDQKVGIEVRVMEGKPAPLPNPELSPKIVYLVNLAAERKKEAEQVQIGGEGCNSVQR